VQLSVCSDIELILIIADFYCLVKPWSCI